MNESCTCVCVFGMVEEAMGVAQHHDAVTGTEKQKVAYDYALRLSQGIHAAEVGEVHI